ncbi:S-layer homology domain-containing protein [Jeotgalibacillus malaysiensis]|uniref:S-layer homology domain-containing protein n=1 Tax=Jeotgalibacillus malaysiensis TaxID=1508404 RepID=UPI00384CDCC4
MRNAVKKVTALTGVGVLSLGMLQPVAGEEQGMTGNLFSDVKKSSSIYETMENVFYMGIMSGYQDLDDYTFEMRPYNDVTRAQTAKMLTASLGGEMATQNDSPFIDVTNTYWAHDYITIMADRGIAGGYEDGTFNSQATLTRAQAAKMIVNTFNLPFDENTGGTEFEDVSADHWAAAYVNALVDSEITTGTSPTTFEPEENVTRYQLAAFIDRSLNQAEVNEDQVFLKVREAYGEFRSEYMRGLDAAIQPDATYSFDNLEKELQEVVTEDYLPIVKQNFMSECAQNGDCDGIRYTATIDGMFNKKVLEYSEDRITVQYDELVEGLLSDANYIISLAKEDDKWKLDRYKVDFYKPGELSLNLTKEQALNYIEATYRLHYSFSTKVYSITDLGTNEDGDYLMQLNTDSAYQDTIRFDIEDGRFYY